MRIKLQVLRLKHGTGKNGKAWTVASAVEAQGPEWSMPAPVEFFVPDKATPPVVEGDVRVWTVTELRAPFKGVFGLGVAPVVPLK